MFRFHRTRVDVVGNWNRRRRNRLTRRACLAAAAGLLVAGQATATTHYWVGGGTHYPSSTADWSDTANWSPNNLPSSSADDIYFGNLSTTNFFASGTNIWPDNSTTDYLCHSLVIETATGFTIQDASDGNSYNSARINLATGSIIRFNLTGQVQQTIQTPIFLGSSGQWTNYGTTPLVLACQMYQPAGATNLTIDKGGPGPVTIQGSALDHSTNYAYFTPYTDPLWTGTLNINQGYVTIQNFNVPNVSAINQAMAHTINVASGTYLNLNTAFLDSVATVSRPTNVTINGNGVNLGLLFGSTGAIESSGYSSLGTVTVATASSINATDDLFVEGLAGGGDLTQIGSLFSSGKLTVTGPSPTFSGHIYVNYGTFESTGPGVGSSSGIVVSSGSTFTLTNGTSDRSISVAGTGNASTTSTAAFVLNENTGIAAVWSGPVTLTGNTTLGTDTDEAGIISGNIGDGGSAYGITKVGGGRTTLSGNNTFTGPITVSAGILGVGSANGIPSGDVTTVQSGATLEIEPGIAPLRFLYINGDGYSYGTQIPLQGALSSPSGVTGWNGGIVMQSNSSIGVAAGTLTVAGNILGNFTVRKIGAGQLVLTSQTNSFGALNVNAGTVTINTDSVIPPAAPITVTASGADLEISGNSSFNRTLNLNSTGIASAGALLNTAGNNNWMGPITLQTNSSIGVSAGQLTLSGPINGPGTLTKVGSQTLYLTGAANYLNLTIAAGAVQLGSAAATPATLVVTCPVGETIELPSNFTATSTLNVIGNGVAGAGAIHALAGTTGVLAGPLVLAGNATINTDPGVVYTINASTNPITETTPGTVLTKTGTGTLRITGTNNVSGGLVVNGGVLAPASDAALGAPLAPVTVNFGARIQFTSTTSTSGRAFSLNSGSIGVDSGMSVTYTNTILNGGFLRGPGTNIISTGTALTGVSPLPGANVLINAPTPLYNLTNSGNITINAASTWSGGLNASTANLIVNNNLAADSFGNNGIIAINPGAVLSNDVSNLTSGGGSRIYIGSKAGPGGTLTLLNGTTLELNGALLVNNGTINGTTNVNYGSLTKGSGAFGVVNVNDGGKFSPGNSPGLATAQSCTLGSGGGYVFEITNATGAPGVGYDQLTLSGALGINAGTTANSVFTVEIDSLDAANNPAPAANFDPNRDQNWAFIHAAGGISGFNAGSFAVNSTGFANPTNGGLFAVTLDPTSTNLLISYSAPQWALATGGTWPVSGNWIGGVPTISANFLGKITTPATITLDGPRTVQGLIFDNPTQSYTIAPGVGGTLTLNNGASPVTIDVISGAHSITAPMVSTAAVNKTGPGTLTLSGNNTGLTGGTIINAGFLVTTNANALGGATATATVAVAGTLQANAPGISLAALGNSGITTLYGGASSITAAPGNGALTVGTGGSLAATSIRQD
ncbi:MAG: beta strand repeat-containing protein, partial [Tepidisphaerales bacterium]